jgi:hypothetical protein
MRGAMNKESGNNMTSINEHIDDEEKVADDVPDF